MKIRASKSSQADIIAAEASAWFIEFRTGETTTGDRARFYEWLRRSPDHIQTYLEIAEGWAELPTSDPGHRIDIQELVRQAREGKDENVVVLPPASRALPRQRTYLLTGLAACLAAATLVIGLAVWGYLSQANTYRTGIGEQRTVRLVDGSTMELNALSSVRVRFSDNIREVDLRQGEALFHVAKDRARPFLVHSDGTTVRAVGTQFDVYRKTSGTVVTVLEGRVAVAEAILVAGEQLTVPTTEATTKEVPKPKHADVTAATAWVQKHLIFEDTPLAEVAEEFNRYSTRRLLIADPQLRSLGVSGVYSSTDPDSLLGFLRAQPNIQLNETDKEIRITLQQKK